MHFKLRLIPAATAGVLLVACGGGGNPSSTAVTYTPTSGIALDGYLQFAKVVCDTNENGVADATEPTVYTLGSVADSGKFTFPQGCATHSMIASGGTNADTGLMFNGVLKAPAGATVISPFTTLMASGMTLTQLTAALGPMGADPLHTDPLAQPDLAAYKKALAVQQLLQKTTELLAGLGGVVGSAAIQPIYTEVTAALVAALQSGATPAPLLSPGASPVMDESVVNAFVLQAVQRVAAAPTVSAAVKTALAAINSAALANVVAPGMQVQAQTLLASSNGGLVAATVAAQSSTYITDYVKYVKPQLASTPAPSASVVTALGATLKSDVTNGINSIVEGATDKVLVSFDEATPQFTGMGAYGGALPTTPAAPSGGNGNALKIIKPAGAADWGGVFFGVTPIPFAADRKKISARVYSTRTASVIKFKVEIAGGSNVEIASSPTGQANTWSTVTWDFSAVDITKSYTTVAITPDFGVTTSDMAYYIDDITLLAAATPPTTGDYLSVANDAISLTDRGVTTPLSLTAFQTIPTVAVPGVRVKWPLSSPATLNVTLAQVGNFTLASTQTLKAAVQITETDGRLGKVMAYIDNVSVSKSDSNMTISVPVSGSAAKVYGVSTDGAKKAIIDFSNSVKNVTNTLSLTSANSILFGDMVNYAINNVSNDFTGITGLRGTYKVTIVVSDLPLKKADGSAFAPFTINVPTALDANGATTSTMPVTGLGLEGYITLTE